MGALKAIPRLAVQLYGKLGARNMTASWCNSGHRDDEHGMMSSIEASSREMGGRRGMRAD